MAKGNEIVVSSRRRGLEISGYMKTGQTCKPGMCLQIDFDSDEVNGLHVFELYDGDVDGGRPKGPLIIADCDFLQGRDTTYTYSALSLVKGYVPVAGDQLNILLVDVAGTADDHARGEVVIPKKGTGKFIATAGTPEIEPFVIAETVTDPTADTLTHVYCTGY